MSMRSLFCARLVVAALCGPLLFNGSVRAETPPNIILLMGDDHGWDETGYNGHPHLQTPVLDEIAATGLRLDNFYSGHPSCSPTRGSVLTGRHPIRYGTFAPNYSMRPEEITIAHVLGEAGYVCGHFGKWHVGPVKASSPTNPGAMGFDQWLSHDNFFELNPTFSRNGGPPETFEGESSEIIIEEAIHFIEQTADNKPFLVVVWFGSPHEPYSGLADDLADYDGVRSKYPGQSVKLTSNETGQPTERPLGEVLQERYAEITAMDRAIGRLRDWLQEAQLRDNTLLWYCGDNGTPSGGIVTSPFRGQKGTMYEGGIRVPGLIEWPARITQSQTSTTSTVTSDMLPTLCELTGQPLPQRPLDGISLMPLFDGRMAERSAPIFFWSGRAQKGEPYLDPALQEGTTPLVKMMAGRYTRNFTNYRHPEITERDYGGTRVMLDGPYKLIVDDRKTELFDLSRDPAEKNNLADSQANIADRMSVALRTWQTSVLESLTGTDY
jgi:arylsulfatase A-like enzyme